MITNKNKYYLNLEMPTSSDFRSPETKLLSTFEVKHELTNPDQNPTVQNLKQVRSTLTKAHYQPFSLVDTLDQYDDNLAQKR